MKEKLRTISLGFILLMLTFNLFADDLNQEETFFINSCEKGNMQSCMTLGQNYAAGTYRGIQEKRNFTQSFKYLLKACDGGILRSCNFAAHSYFTGLGATQNYIKAKSLYEKSCTDDELSGCNSLAKMYEKGLGVKADYNKANVIYKKICLSRYDNSSSNKLNTQSK